MKYTKCVNLLIPFEVINFLITDFILIYVLSVGVQLQWILGCIIAYRTNIVVFSVYKHDFVGIVTLLPRPK